MTAECLPLVPPVKTLTEPKACTRLLAGEQNGNPVASLYYATNPLQVQMYAYAYAYAYASTLTEIYSSSALPDFEL